MVGLVGAHSCARVSVASHKNYIIYALRRDLGTRMCPYDLADVAWECAPYSAAVPKIRRTIQLIVELLPGVKSSGVVV
jgi:hypothetical protein